MVRMQIRGDNAAVIHWLEGVWVAKYAAYDPWCKEIHSQQELLLRNTVLMSPEPGAKLWQHVYREHNQRADALAGSGAVGSSECPVWLRWPTGLSAEGICVMGNFDGSWHNTTRAGGFGWHVSVSKNGMDWIAVAHCCGPVRNAVSATGCELMAAVSLHSWITALFTGGLAEASNVQMRHSCGITLMQ